MLEKLHCHILTLNEDRLRGFMIAHKSLSRWTQTCADTYLFTQWQ